jgi:aldehyde dehydrogenase
MDVTLIQDVVSEVMRRMNNAPAPQNKSAEFGANQYGVFKDVDQAVQAATEAQKQLIKLSLDDRDAIVKIIKNTAKENASAWGKIEFDETKIGRLDHKIEKLRILELVPGVEYLKTHAQTGSNGICLEEFAPFGVIGAITPVTHSVPTLSANAVTMIASGNSLVINPHPSGSYCAAVAVSEYNKRIKARFGIEHLITIINPPTLESADAIFAHRGVHLLVVTGGPVVARAAMKSSKRAIVAGPGNPPVVVDETACMKNTAESIISGASFDNNLLCIGEKQIFVVDSAYERLVAALITAGAVQLNTQQIATLTSKAFKVDPKDNQPHVNKEYVGKDARDLVIAAGGISVPPTCQLAFGETTFDHPFVQQEQMMPFIPIVRCRTVDEAMDKAIESEHGYRHTAIIHSRNLDTITRFGRRAATTLFVVNGASPSGLGLGGQGHLSYSIATPTGEGITTPLTFTRYRRIMITGSLRMV